MFKLLYDLISSMYNVHTFFFICVQFWPLNSVVLLEIVLEYSCKCNECNTKILKNIRKVFRNKQSQMNLRAESGF